MAKAVGANASALATKLIIEANTIAYKTLETDLNITPANVLDKFIYYSNM